MGLWGAALASAVSFASAHAYPGRSRAIRAETLGAGFAVLAIATGSIVPGMALHVPLDWVSGEASHAVFAEPTAGPAAT